MTTWIPAGPAILFVPADRPDRFAKAAERADMVILDLEDGCRPENRAEARRAIIESEKAGDLDPERVIVRINPVDSPEHAADLEMLADLRYDLVMLPKAESAASVESLAGHRVIALIETPLGVLRADDVASADNVVAMFWGAEDLTAGLGGTASRFGDGEKNPGTYRDVARHARADRCAVTLTYQPDSVSLDVVDDGIGFDPAADPPPGAVGIAGVRRRMDALGGQLVIESAPGSGCGVSVRVPLDDGKALP